MNHIGQIFHQEIQTLLETLSVTESTWLSSLGTVFEPEFSSPVQIQLRLDSSLAAAVFKSHYPTVRSRFYGLLGDQEINFTAAAGCERLARVFPDGAWRIKIALSGTAPHAKLYLDRPLIGAETPELFDSLFIPEDVGEKALALLFEVAETDVLERVSTAPGHPIRVELYASRGPTPGGGSRLEEILAEPTGLIDSESLKTLANLHGNLCQFGRQCYVIGVDGRGHRDGMKVEYSNVPVDELDVVLEGLTDAPMMAKRRLRIASRTLAMTILDHLSVRLRPGKRPHITASFNRAFAAVA